MPGRLPHSAGVKELMRNKLLIIAALGTILVVSSLIVWGLFGEYLPGSVEEWLALRTQVDAFLETIPPVWYFVALVILPAAGAPLTLFYLTALPVLGSQHSMIGILLVWLALLLNMTLAKFLTHGLFHPLISWAIRHRGLHIPRIQPANEWQILLALRLSPIPFALQNYLLALGHARWRSYLWASLPIQAGIGTAVMLLGESILSGGFGYVLLAVSLFFALQLLVRYLRNQYLTTKTNAQSPSL